MACNFVLLDVAVRKQEFTYEAVIASAPLGLGMLVILVVCQMLLTSWLIYDVIVLLD